MFPRHERLDARRVYLINRVFGSVSFNLYVAVNLIWQAQVANLSPLELVLVGTVLESTAFVFEVPTGVVADVYGRRLSVIIGFFLGGVATLIEGLFPSFGPILLAQVVSSIGYTFVSGALSAWITDEVGEERVGPVFLRASQIGQAIGILTVPVAVVLGSLALNLPMLVSAGLQFVRTAFLVLFMPETGFAPVSREGRSSWRAMADTLVAGTRLVRERPRFLWIFGIAAFFGMASEGVDRLSTPHFLRTVGFPDIGHFQPVVWFGAMDICASVLIIAANEVVRRRLDTADQRATAPALLAFNFLQIAGVLGFAAATDFPTAFLAYLGLTVFRHLFLPVYDAWLNQGIDSRVRATVLSMSSQSNAIGQVVGGPVVGVIGSVISLRAALATSGLVLAPALLLYRRASRQLAAAVPAEEIGVAVGSTGRSGADPSEAGAGEAPARED